MKKHKVIDAVHQHFGIDPSLRTRRREVVDTRQAIMVALRNYYNLKEIADMFTFTVRKDGEVTVRTMNHATVLHATREHALKYNDNPERRFRHYELYCDVYDFCTSYLESEPYRPITQEQMRREIETFKHLRDEAERNLQQAQLYHEAQKEEFKEQVKELSKQNKALEKKVRDLTNERNKIKAAFTALYKEKKAKAELNK
jgi:hypothetical protein